MATLPSGSAWRTCVRMDEDDRSRCEDYGCSLRPEARGCFRINDNATRTGKWSTAARLGRRVLAGLLCVLVPEDYGGSGGTYAHEAVIAGPLGRTAGRVRHRAA